MNVKLLDDTHCLIKITTHIQIIELIILIANIFTINNKTITLCVAVSNLTFMVVDLILFVVNVINIKRLKKELLNMGDEIMQDIKAGKIKIEKIEKDNEKE